MGTEDSLGTDATDRSDEAMIQLRCDCGNWLTTATRKQRVDCECGKSFAVTVTNLFATTSPTTD